MEKNIFISSGAFQTSDLGAILDACVRNPIGGLELGSNIAFSEEILSRLESFSKKRDVRLLIHNYFPPPREPFVLNLASDDPKMLSLSLGHCRGAIDLSQRLGAKFYSVHCGFAFHARPRDLGGDLTQAPRFSLEDAEETFVESLRMLAEYAQARGIQLLIENNVLSRANLIGGKNVLFLGVTAEEIARCIDRVGKNNTGVLMDVGHLKVSAESLRFDARNFIKRLAPWVKAVHLSDNDGIKDEHLPVTQGSWFWRFLKEIKNEDMVFVLEAGGLTQKTMKDQVGIILSELF